MKKLKEAFSETVIDPFNTDDASSKFFNITGAAATKEIHTSLLNVLSKGRGLVPRSGTLDPSKRIHSPMQRSNVKTMSELKKKVSGFRWRAKVS